MRRKLDISPTPIDVLNKLFDEGWRRLSEPTPWRPEPGDEIEGIYQGSILCGGRFGQFRAAVITRHLSTCSTSHTITGSHLMTIIQFNDLQAGDKVLIRYVGKESIDNDRHIKRFEVFVNEKQLESR